MVTAAQRLNVSVILQVHPSSLHFGGPPLIAMLQSFKKHHQPADQGRIFIHLDHAEKEDEIQLALDCGVDSVMVDGSHLEFEENLRWTAKMVQSLYVNPSRRS